MGALVPVRWWSIRGLRAGKRCLQVSNTVYNSFTTDFTTGASVGSPVEKFYGKAIENRIENFPKSQSWRYSFCMYLFLCENRIQSTCSSGAPDEGRSRGIRGSRIGLYRHADQTGRQTIILWQHKKSPGMISPWELFYQFVYPIVYPVNIEDMAKACRNNRHSIP